MYIKDEKIEDIRISNRRNDDIVVIMRHDFFLETKKNQMTIDYMNDYGCKFFNISKNKILGIGNDEHELVLFGSILSQKTKQIIYETLTEESEDNFETHDLAAIIRKIPNFTMLNSLHEQTLVNLRIFHLKQEEHFNRNKTVRNMYYYLIIQDATFDMRIAEYRMQFLEKIGGKIVLDQLTNIHNIQSTIDELKMVIKYQNSHKDIKIISAMIEINTFFHDYILINSIVNNFMRNTRIEDFIGHFSDRRLLLILYDIDLEYAKKPLKRLYNIILSDQYIYDQYRNQRNDIISIGFTKLQKNDTIDDVQKRLENALENNKNIINELRISHYP
jgi:hypothetical protein